MSTGGVAIDSDVVEVGGVLTADVAADGPRRLELGYRIIGEQPASSIVAALDLQDSTREVAIDIPDHGPMSYDGELFSVSWALTVRVAGDAIAEIPITVLPRGGLTLWARQAAPPPEPD